MTRSVSPFRFFTRQFAPWRFAVSVLLAFLLCEPGLCAPTSCGPILCRPGHADDRAGVAGCDRPTDQAELANQGAVVNQGAVADRPNIIMVFVDDMGFTDLGCFGGTGVTPNIDRLAREGIRFRNFYVSSPICSPSRTALTTGQYPQRLRITSYLDNRQRNLDRGVAQWLDVSTPTIASRLQQAGYATGHFGKWHMGGQRDVGDAPLIEEYGFDASLTNFEGLGPRVLPLNDAYDGKPGKKHDLGSAALGRGPVRWADRSTVTSEFVKEALTFLAKAQADRKPFYLNLWPDDVHSPFFPPQKLREATENNKQALYYAVLQSMDQQLGVIFDHVRNDDQLRDNTLIVFASDNGHEEGAGRSEPLRGGKTWLYEGGVRSPLIVWGPGLIDSKSSGSVNDVSVLCAMDLNRSLTILGGAEIEAAALCDGEELVDTILGRSVAGRKAPIFWRRPPDRPGTKTEDNPDLAVRDGHWKFLINYDRSQPQLYNLETDVSESQNIAQDHPDVVTRLTEAVFEWNSQMPIDAGDPAFRPAEATASLPSNQFVNPIAEGADPWVVRDPNAPRYLWCLSDGNRSIAIHTSDRLTSLGQKHIVWSAPENGPWSKEVWAPELHFLDGHWHIYFAASDGRNENHLAYVLRSESADPLSSYTLHGPLATGDGDAREGNDVESAGVDGRSPHVWAIDMTVLEHREKRYAIWSGWDAPGSDRQYLYIAPMKSPTELAAPRVRLCPNDDFAWELTEPKPQGRGLNEGPQALIRNNRTFVSYSCGASWLPNYKLGLLELTGDNPLNPGDWKKFAKPAFQGTEQTFGVGHSCFVPSPDGHEWWHVFHAKREPAPGWRRAIFVQPMSFDPQGMPMLKEPVKAGVPLKRPSGESTSELQLPYSNPLSSPDDLIRMSYLGHHQFWAPGDGLNSNDRAEQAEAGQAEPGLARQELTGIVLGVVPGAPVNDYRSGEKLLLLEQVPSDFTASVTISFDGNSSSRDAGLLFRTSAESVGYDNQRGYFAGLIPRTGLVILGRTDGNTWTELARASTTINVNTPQRLRVTATEEKIVVFHNDRSVLQVTDGTWDSGTIGLRVVDTQARFSDLRIDRPTAGKQRP